MPATAQPPALTGGNQPTWTVCAQGEYDLSQAVLLTRRDGESLKKLHGQNQWLIGGDVSVTPQGLLLRAGAEGPTAWASPILWSGVKNVRVAVRLTVRQAGPQARCGIKLGNTWAIGEAGPRVSLYPQPTAARLTFADQAAPLTPVKLGQSLRLQASYLFEGSLFEAQVDEQPPLRVALPHEPFEEFLDRLGRPAPLTGLGVFAEDCDVLVEHFAYTAGAPPRRVVVIGDSITQRAFWVHELERALQEPVTNLGIGGDSAKLVAQRFARDVLPLQPTCVVIFAGTNDLGWGRKPPQVAQTLAAIARQAQAAGIKPMLCELLPRRGYPQIPDYNSAIHQVASDLGIPVLAWHAAVLDPQTQEMKPGYAPDGTHPVRAGAQAMVQALDLQVFH